MKWKHKIELAQSLVSIGAILVGGWWTYDNFIKERKNLPHGNIEHIVSHYPLTKDINLLSIVLKIVNSGHARMDVAKTDIWIQQVLPMLPCAENEIRCTKDQVNIAMKETTRREDRFSWTIIAGRETSLKSPLLIEPGETEYMDFEFAVPADIKMVRIYSYVRNETNKELGWHFMNFYQLSSERSKSESG